MNTTRRFFIFETTRCLIRSPVRYSGRAVMLQACMWLTGCPFNHICGSFPGRWNRFEVPKKVSPGSPGNVSMGVVMGRTDRYVGTILRRQPTGARIIIFVPLVPESEQKQATHQQTNMLPYAQGFGSRIDYTSQRGGPALIGRAAELIRTSRSLLLLSVCLWPWLYGLMGRNS